MTTKTFDECSLELAEDVSIFCRDAGGLQDSNPEGEYITNPEVLQGVQRALQSGLQWILQLRLSTRCDKCKSKISLTITFFFLRATIRPQSHRDSFNTTLTARCDRLTRGHHRHTHPNTHSVCPYTHSTRLPAHVLLLTSSAEGPISAFCPSPSTIRSSSWEIPVRDSPTEHVSDWNCKSNE